MSNSKQSTIHDDDDHDDGDDTLVQEWVDGLPEPDTIPELSQLLAPPELANAFCIPPLPIQTSSSVAHAVDATMFSLFSRFNAPQTHDEEMTENQDSGKRKMDEVVEDQEDGELTAEEQQEPEKNKRQRLMWTPKLHKRFIDAIKHLGMNKAVPTAILQVMNVEGLTRANVASHLQKYRLYLQNIGYAGSITTRETRASEPHGMTGMPPMPLHGAEHYHMMMQQHPYQQQHPYPHQQQHPHPHPLQLQQHPHPHPHAHRHQQHPHPHPHQQQHPRPHQQQQHPHRQQQQ